MQVFANLQIAKLHLSLGSLGVALVAFGCAFLVQTKQLELNYAYPVEVLLKTVLTDDVFITTSHCTK
ncbi:hypothetical protein [Botryobacter ruber]|uniref:hypothetical protein n=1 Tax=Botryobacter ruber TaxID=2171629 RepID=UPI000E0BDF35|nr:hypothetical protein [Botryobacter ruber]